jgi:hypothetical protein
MYRYIMDICGPCESKAMLGQPYISGGGKVRVRPRPRLDVPLFIQFVKALK